MVTSAGMTTSSKLTPVVLLARWPMFHSFSPGLTPGQSCSTMNAVKAFPAGALGSSEVRANTKYLRRECETEIG